MKTQNLLNDLHGNEIDQSELEQILSSHFGRATGVSPQEIQYNHLNGTEPALILLYNKDGELTAVEPAPGLKESDLPDIQEKLNKYILTSGEVQIGQSILFAHAPTTGYFRYRDLFQIVPVPADAPRPEFIMGDHPLLLQFSYGSSADAQVGMLRRARIGREIELLCVALTTALKGAVGPMVRHHWVLTDTSDPANWRSHFCQEMYTWPGASGLTSAFSSIDGLVPISCIPASTYYTRQGISPGQTLDLPENFEELLDAYFACAHDDRDRFLRAIYWFQYAQQVHTYSSSGSFIALVSAVEALMPPPKGNGRCSECGKLIGSGPTQRFAEFVEHYAPSPTVKEDHRKKLYALRSALSHGGTLLHSDRFAWSGGMTSKSLTQWENQTIMWQVVRLVLVNWLLKEIPTK